MAYVICQLRLERSMD